MRLAVTGCPSAAGWTEELTTSASGSGVSADGNPSTTAPLVARTSGPEGDSTAPGVPVPASVADASADGADAVGEGLRPSVSGAEQPTSASAAAAQTSAVEGERSTMHTRVQRGGGSEPEAACPGRGRPRSTGHR